MGYHRAGFDVVGVDIKPQPRYPFEFIQGDALEYLQKAGKDFDVIHASPPCQSYSICASLTTKSHPQMVEVVRDSLIQAGKPYIIENVPGSPLKNPLMLCGSMFGLGVIRHRLFESCPALYWPPSPCAHIGRATGSNRSKFGDGVPSLKEGYSYVTVAGKNYIVAEGREAMGIDWMIGRELSQAIPPAYTEWLGTKIKEALI